MAPLVRAITYASLFIAFFLFFVPTQLLEWAGVSRPAQVDWVDLLGIGMVVFGLGLAIWCVLTFAVIGRGTPAPFDPPRRLVVRGPYRFVRNPMYTGAVGALAGAALFFGTWWLAAFAVGFFLVSHVFVVTYEEPALDRVFGSEYQSYCAAVGRWLPRRRAYQPDETRRTE
jgi:protein-S-isoprenylcysteine O-methyltransferase Ste14